MTLLFPKRGFSIIVAITIELGTLSHATDTRQGHSTAMATAFVEQHCVQCHGPEKQKSDVRLDILGFNFQDEEVAWQWQDAVDMLRIGDMPPKDEPQPSPEEIEAMTAWLGQQLQTAYQAPSEDTKPRLRRMNRQEYLYTIRDLLGVNIESFNPTANFPRDERYHGFDNLGEKLVFSNYLFEQYLHSAAESIGKVIDIPAQHSPFETTFTADDFKVTYGIPGEQNAHLEDPHYHHRGFDYYMVNVDHKYVDFGHGESRQQRLHNPHFEGVPATGYYDITVKAEAVGRINPYDPEIIGVDPDEPLQMRLIANDPKVGDTGYGYNISNRIFANFNLADNQIQDYTARVWLDKGYNIALRYPNGPQRFMRVGRQVIERYHPETIVSNYKDEFSLQPPPGEIREKWFSDVYQGPRLRIHSMTIKSAPVEQWPPANYQSLFKTKTHQIDPANAPEIIDELAQRAFRRPLIPGETDRYKDLYQQLYQENNDPRYALKGALGAILSSPDFLYIQSSSQAASPLKDRGIDPEQYALASRLSYFLWSSLPDEALLEAARQGILNQEEVLRMQAKRMLKDAKADAFAHHFTDSWLELHKLGTHPPDSKSFTSYSIKGLEPQMRRETHLFFQYILNENRDVAEFIDSDYTFLNEDLAEHYNIPGIEGSAFRRVSLPKDSIRGGLMGQASILTATANGIETSPVVRGVWVLENILGTPLPPPPANIEPIDPDTRGAITIRERLLKHQKVESCAECHVKIDPPGFALEAFDPVGGFREYYKDDKGENTREIDTRVTLHSGESVQNLSELRAILLQTRKDQFLLGLSKKALTYALGRELLLSDRPSLDRIVESTIQSGYGFQDLILEVVSSEAFRDKKAKSASTHSPLAAQ